MKKILVITLTFFSLNSFAGDVIGGGSARIRMNIESLIGETGGGEPKKELVSQFNLSNRTLEDIKSITTKDGAIILKDEIIDVDSQHNYYDHLNKIKSFLLHNGNSIQTKNIGRFILL